VSYDFFSAALSASAMNALTSAELGGLASLRAATSTASVRYERTSLVSSFLNSDGEPNRSTVATLPLSATAKPTIRARSAAGILASAAATCFSMVPSVPSDCCFATMRYVSESLVVLRALFLAATSLHTSRCSA
jgi:hypothetical protein